MKFPVHAYLVVPHASANERVGNVSNERKKIEVKNYMCHHRQSRQIGPECKCKKKFDKRIKPRSCVKKIVLCDLARWLCEKMQCQNMAGFWLLDGTQTCRWIHMNAYYELDKHWPYQFMEEHILGYFGFRISDY